jgi:hypothetical protein
LLTAEIKKIKLSKSGGPSAGYGIEVPKR